MDVAALPRSLGQYLHNRPFTPRKPRPLRIRKSFQLVALSRLGNLHSEHLAPAFPIDSDGHKHCPGSDHSVAIRSELQLISKGGAFTFRDWLTRPAKVDRGVPLQFPARRGDEPVGVRSYLRHLRYGRLADV